jgi:hypothetical protein
MEVCAEAPKRQRLQEEFSPELLRLYYDRLFPAGLMCRWLGYGSQHDEDAASQLLPKREFSFTTGDDVYIRYLSYEDAAGLRKDLVQKLPHKIDIGAIFSAAPRDHKKFKLFEPLQREFIIDIDLTDYDFLDVDVKRLETCDRCWPLMALALRVLTKSLQEDFGFEQLLWVYSGRRGIHCWVCDTSARVMSNEVRSAVADYLGPKLNPATGLLAISIPMHPTLAKHYSSELKPFFESKLLTSPDVHTPPPPSPQAPHRARHTPLRSTRRRRRRRCAATDPRTEPCCRMWPCRRLPVCPCARVRVPCGRGSTRVNSSSPAPQPSPSPDVSVCAGGRLWHPRGRGWPDQAPRHAVRRLCKGLPSRTVRQTRQ